MRIRLNFGTKREEYDDFMSDEEFEEEMAWLSSTREYESEEEYYDLHPEDLPEACSACGGPYPLCMDGCNLFDD